MHIVYTYYIPVHEGGKNTMLLTKVQEVGTNNTISIPKDVIKHLNLKKSDRVVWQLQKDDTVIIKKLVV